MTKKSVILAFLQSKKYRYVTRVSAIPMAAMSRFAILEGDLKICDVESGLPIDLTDTPLDEHGCRKKLIFALVGDSACLFSYLHGGIAVTPIVYYIKYKGSLQHVKYMASGEISDTTQLNNLLRKQVNIFLREATNPEDDSLNRLTPPPPWPQHSH